jgi:hypothetical protein
MLEGIGYSAVINFCLIWVNCWLIILLGIDGLIREFTQPRLNLSLTKVYMLMYPSTNQQISP